MHKAAEPTFVLVGASNPMRVPCLLPTCEQAVQQMLLIAGAICKLSTTIWLLATSGEGTVQVWAALLPIGPA